MPAALPARAARQRPPRTPRDSLRVIQAVGTVVSRRSAVLQICQSADFDLLNAVVVTVLVVGLALVFLTVDRRLDERADRRTTTPAREGVN